MYLKTLQQRNSDEYPFTASLKLVQDNVKMIAS